MDPLERIEGLAEEIITMLLGGSCRKTEVMLNAEEILQIAGMIRQNSSSVSAASVARKQQ
jgi:hypothetical protein